MPNLIERLDAVLASLEVVERDEANARAMTFFLENNLTLREALRDAERPIIPPAAYDGYRVFMDAQQAALRGQGVEVTAQQVSSVLDAFVRVAKADAAIDQERGDRLGRDGGG